MVNLTIGAQYVMPFSARFGAQVGTTPLTKTSAIIPITASMKVQTGDTPLPPEEEQPADAGGAGGAVTPITPASTNCNAKHGISDDEAALTENEGAAHPFGTSAAGLARERAVNAAQAGGADPVVEATNNAQAVPAACQDLGAKADERTKLSGRFTAASFSTKANLPHALRAQRGLSKQEIICNLRHLAVNAAEPIFDHFEKLGYTIKISSGFRPGRGGSPTQGSDHEIGSAMDLKFFYGGRVVEGAHLTRIQKAIDQVLRIPYTQMIHELNRILHVACRRSGNNSGTRNAWSRTNGHGDFQAGYRHNVSLEGSPPVK